jgi:aspartyl-tRNA synthetase
MKNSQKYTTTNKVDIENCHKIANLLSRLNILRENSQNGNQTLVLPNSFQDNCFETGFLNYIFHNGEVIIKIISEAQPTANIQKYKFEDYHAKLQQELADKEWAIPILNHQHKIISNILCKHETLYPQEFIHKHQGNNVATTNLKSQKTPLWSTDFPVFEISTTGNQTTITKHMFDGDEPKQVSFNTSEILAINIKEVEKKLIESKFINPETKIELTELRKLKSPELSKSSYQQ